MKIIVFCSPVKVSVAWPFVLHLLKLRAVEKVGQWIQWRFGLSYFHWNFLGLHPSPPKGKPLCSRANTSTCVKYMSTHKHAHMHNTTLFLKQFTEPFPIMGWSYHISENTGFSTNMWSDQRRSSCTQDVERAWTHHYYSALWLWAVCCQSDWWSADQWSHHQAQLTAGKNAAWYVNVLFVGYKCDLGWNVGLVRSSRAAADRSQGSLLLL